MKINKTLASLAVGTVLVVTPLAAFADTANAQVGTGIYISPSGIVRAIGADVTAVGTNVVDAVLNIGNTVINVVLNTSGNTTIVANGSKTATTTDVKVGDTVTFKGTLASSTVSGVTVNATKVRDITNSPKGIVNQPSNKTKDNDNDGDKDQGGNGNASTTVKANVGLHLGLGTLFGGLRLGKDH